MSTVRDELIRLRKEKQGISDDYQANKKSYRRLNTGGQAAMSIGALGGIAGASSLGRINKKMSIGLMAGGLGAGALGKALSMSARKRKEKGLGTYISKNKDIKDREDSMRFKSDMKKAEIDEIKRQVRRDY